MFGERGFPRSYYLSVHAVKREHMASEVGTDSWASGPHACPSAAEIACAADASHEHGMNVALASCICTDDQARARSARTADRWWGGRKYRPPVALEVKDLPGPISGDGAGIGSADVLGSLAYRESRGLLPLASTSVMVKMCEFSTRSQPPREECVLAFRKRDTQYMLCPNLVSAIQDSRGPETFAACSG